MERINFLYNYFKTYNIKLVVFFLSFSLSHHFLLSDFFQVNYYSPENILKFAEQLYQEGDYIRAAAEFQRYLFYCNEYLTAKDSIYYKIGVCFRLGKDFQKSISYFQKVIDEYPHSNHSADSYYQVGYSLFLMGNYKESISFSDANASIVKSEITKLKMQQLIGLNYIYQKQWTKSIEYFNSLEGTAKNSPLTATLEEFARYGQELPRKSRFLAGLMSAIIPGTGKMYCHRATDGLFSLITIALTSWQAYEGFHEKGVNSVKGWIYGTISTFFYFGNIYGSIVSAKIYNKRLETNLLEEVGIAINAYF